MGVRILSTSALVGNRPGQGAAVDFGACSSPDAANARRGGPSGCPELLAVVREGLVDQAVAGKRGRVPVLVAGRGEDGE